MHVILIHPAPFYGLLHLTGHSAHYNYFDNSVLSIYQKRFKKAMIGRIYRVVSSQTNVKWVFVEILEGHGQPQKFIE